METTPSGKPQNPGRRPVHELMKFGEEALPAQYLVVMRGRSRLRNRPLALDGFQAGTRLQRVMNIIIGNARWEEFWIEAGSP